MTDDRRPLTDDRFALDARPVAPVASRTAGAPDPTPKGGPIRFRPFRAWRPVPELAARVAAPPYDVVTRAEAAALAKGNPFSFLHVARADIDVPAETDPHDARVYATARANLEMFFGDGTFIHEAAPSIYVYQLSSSLGDQVGVVGCVHVDDYAENVILKHETTRPDKEADRTHHILTVNAHAEPVLLAHEPSPFLGQLHHRDMTEAPLYDFTGPDGVRHRLWRVHDPATYVDAFRRIRAAYVADGHHRCASALSAARERRAHTARPTGDEEYNWFPAVLFPSSQLHILAYNRAVKDLNGRSPEDFLAALGGVGIVKPSREAAPGRSGAFGVLVGGSWYRLELDPASIRSEDPVASLDASLLQERVLGPLLGIRDPRTDPRIEFVGGLKGTEELERRVRSGEAAVGFALNPVNIQQLIAIADAGAVMPPKSTWFEPKLLSGLFVHPLDGVGQEGATR